MERRKFIRSATATSACALTGAFIPDKTSGMDKKEDFICKLTVLKKTIHLDLYEKYRNGPGSICQVFEEGQEFEFKTPFEHPEGFCHWAWADIRHYVQAVYFGRPETVVTCCTDGFRPVLFKIERVRV